VKGKFFKTALLTSPIIAVYGVSPMFLFNTIGAERFLDFLGLKNTYLEK
jgi:hypothetical protein